MLSGPLSSPASARPAVRPIPWSMDPGPFASAWVALSRAEVRYLVVGGAACVLNGFVRTTEDVDLVLEAEPANLRRLLDTLATRK